MTLVLTKLIGQTVDVNGQCCWNYNGNCESHEEIIFLKNNVEHFRIHGLSHNVQIRCREDKTFKISRSPQLLQCQNRVGSPALTEGSVNVHLFLFYATQDRMNYVTGTSTGFHTVVPLFARTGRNFTSC